MSPPRLTVTCPPPPSRSDCLAVDPEKPKPKFVKEVLEKCMRYRNAVLLFTCIANRVEPLHILSVVLLESQSKSSILDRSSTACSAAGSPTTSGSWTSFLRPSRRSSQQSPPSSSSIRTTALVRRNLVSPAKDEPFYEALHAFRKPSKRGSSVSLQLRYQATPRPSRSATPSRTERPTRRSWPSSKRCPTPTKTKTTVSFPALTASYMKMHHRVLQALCCCVSRRGRNLQPAEGRRLPADSPPLGRKVLQPLVQRPRKVGPARPNRTTRVTLITKSVALTLASITTRPGSMRS